MTLYLLNTYLNPCFGRLAQGERSPAFCCERDLKQFANS